MLLSSRHALEHDKMIVRLTSLTIMTIVLLPHAIAQVSGADSLSGGAGWVGAGLLGLVLGWLLIIHLPAKDKQIQTMINGRDQLAKDLSELYHKADDARREEFRRVLDLIVTHCKDETTALAQALHVEMEHLSGTIVELRQAVNVLASVRED